MTWQRRASLGLPVLLSLVGLASSVPQSRAQQISAAHYDAPATRESVLLLANGQVLRGTVALEGDRYIVRSGTSEMHVPREAVEHVCRSLEEGYQRKRATSLATGGEHRIRLIQWCLAHKLYDEAERELNESQQLHPNNLRYDLLRRQLKLAREPIQPAPAPAPPADPPVSDAQLDIFVRTLPGSAVESFSQTVQPLLLNNCAAAGCHGPSPRSEFQLIRLARGITPHRRVTQRNLHAALAWINRENPDQSRLLAAAAQAHGNTPHHKFEGTDGPVFRHLAAWVRQVTQPVPVAPPSTVESSTATLSQSITDNSTGRSAAPPPRRRPAPRGVAGPLGSAPAETSIESAPDSPLSVARPSQEPPADPFDPEVFNQRYHSTSERGDQEENIPPTPR